MFRDTIAVSIIDSHLIFALISLQAVHCQAALAYKSAVLACQLEIAFLARCRLIAFGRIGWVDRLWLV